MAQKSEQDWTHQVVAEFKQSKSVVWRAQLTTSPDGKKFYGIRSFFKKADGTETPNRNGINLPANDDYAKTVDALISMMHVLKSKKVPTADEDKADKPAKSKKVAEPEEAIEYRVKHAQTKRYLKWNAKREVAKWVTKDEATTWTSKKEARAAGVKTGVEDEDLKVVK